MSHNFNSFSEEESLLAAGYVLGDLGDDEILRLKALIEENPGLVQEIQAMQSSFDLMPQSLSLLEVPERLHQKIVTPIESEQRLPQRSSRSTLFKWISGLMAIALAWVVFDNWRLRDQLRVANQARPDRIAEILQQPNSRLIGLTSKASDATGTLLFTPGRWQEVIVSVGNLPPLPPDQIYRLWLALENSEIIYCGEFNTDTDGSIFVRFTPSKTPPKGVKATKLFVTVDAKEGDLQPSDLEVMEGLI